MKQNPKVSVITPIYNAERYLDKYFDSLLNQTLENIEIICVNNVSTDNSLAVLQKFAAKDNRIKVINNKQNTIAGASNIAIRSAKSNYIAILDQDDWVDVDMYKSLIEHSENETVDMVCSDYYEYFNENDKIKKINIPYDIAYSTEEIKKHALLKSGRIFTNIIKKDLFIDNNLFYPENLFYADNAIGAALYLKAVKIKKVNKYFYYYNTGNISQTRSKDNFRFFDRLSATNIMLENMKRLGLYVKYKEEIDYNYYKLFYQNSIIGCFPRFSKFPTKEINQIKNEFNLKRIDIKNNTYYKKKRKNHEDLILGCIEISTYFGYILFKIYKFINPLRKFILK